MSGAAIEISLDGVKRLNQRFAKLAHIDTDKQFLYEVGSTVESQTHNRIRNEKNSPEGIAWPEWSDEYAKTRHSGHSLLMNEGDLDDSITFNVLDDGVEIGSNLVYAARQHFGGKGIPSRKYLGVNKDNLDDVQAVLDKRIDHIMGLS